MNNIPTNRMSRRLHDRPIITAMARKYGALLCSPVIHPIGENVSTVLTNQYMKYFSIIDA